MLAILLTSWSLAGATTPPLRSRIFDHELGRRCVAALAAPARANVVERVVQRALRRQIVAAPLGRTLTPAHLAAMRAHPAVRRYWRLLTLFPDVTWTRENAATSIGVGAGVRLRVSEDSPHKSVLWIDFAFADAASARPFYAAARALLLEAPPPRYNPDDLVKAFDFDARTNSVLVLISDFIADVDQRDLATTDRLGERAYHFVKTLIERR